MFEHREFILPRNRETIMKVKLASVSGPLFGGHFFKVRLELSRLG